MIGCRSGQLSLVLLLTVGSLLLMAIEPVKGEEKKKAASPYSEDVIDRDFLARLAARLEELEKKSTVKDTVPEDRDMEEAFDFATNYVANWERFEANQLEKAEIDRSNPQESGKSHKAYKYFQSFTRNRHNPEAMAESKEASIEMVARQFLSNKLGIPADRIDLDVKSGCRSCNKSVRIDRNTLSCDSTTKFRTMDGSCNSLSNPLFGKSNTIFQRMLWGQYNDGVSVPRRSVFNRELPSARLVSTTVTANESITNPDVTMLTMQWGQFLDHDLTLTPTFTKNDSTAIECCSSPVFGTKLAANQSHVECLPIDIPTNDPAYNPTGMERITCMNFARSVFGKNLDGTTPSMRSHINALTHWIDGSMVYGSDLKSSLALRDTASGRGKMKTSTINGRQMLPLGSNCCNPPDPWGSCPAVCFSAGDSRVNEQPMLTVMHTIWVREHNRIAEQISCQVPGQSDEYYYQHARRIVIAEIQHITYNEYLPVMIGPELAAQVNQQDVYYSPWYNPAIFTEFSTAAFRMGHSQLVNFFRLFERDGRKSGMSFQLSESFNKPDPIINPAFMDNALRGLLQTSAQTVDNCFPDDITSQLFKPRGRNIGFDLISLNIQRGRDHGLPTYLYMLYYLTSNYIYQTTSWTFDHLATRTPLEVVSAFKTVYQNAQDIDLFIGGVTEKPLPKAALGPTFASMFAYQFLRLRQADRFFYNNNVGQTFALSPNQLAEIEKVSFARIICDNSDGTITTIQPKVFRKADDLINKPVPCRNIVGINFANFLPL